MIVLGVSASLVASMTLFAITLLYRLGNRDGIVLRVL
jgi:hypothetical protein